MIESKILLIVGAGASVPYGYPTGYNLRVELCDPNNLIGLRSYIDEIGIKLFCEHFEKSQLYSIDSFLAKRSEDQIGAQQTGAHITYGNYGECGKLAIAYRLMQCENLENLLKPKEDH